MANIIEQSKSSRATCRSCRQKIDKGVLRFGEEIANQFDPQGAPGYFWHHLECAAKKKPLLVKPVLEAYEGDLPNREELLKLLENPGPPTAKDRPYPWADRAPSSRAKCISCESPIEKGTMRVAIEREVDTGSFTTKGPGYLHAACASAHLEDVQLLDKLREHSGLGDEDLRALEAELR